MKVYRIITDVPQGFTTFDPSEFMDNKMFHEENIVPMDLDMDFLDPETEDGYVFIKNDNSVIFDIKRTIKEPTISGQAEPLWCEPDQTIWRDKESFQLWLEENYGR